MESPTSFSSENSSKPSGLSSAIYTGWIRHRRFTPVKNAFKYPLFMFYLDLDEVQDVFEGKWYASIERLNVIRYCRKDYFKPEKTCLKTAVIEEVDAYFKQYQLSPKVITKVRMLTHLRLFNFTFNPVSFYYCFDQNDCLIAILAEITNTPWDEKHHYVLPITPDENHEYPDIHYENSGIRYECSEKDTSSHNAPYLYRLKGRNKHCFDFNKAFHVSPFNPMNMRYHWVFSDPEDSLNVHMDNHLRSEEADHSLSQQLNQLQEKHFDATLTLKRTSIKNNLAEQLIRYPLMTVKVVTGIYWQALKLWVKKAPFYDHPKLSDPSNTEKVQSSSVAKESICND